MIKQSWSNLGLFKQQTESDLKYYKVPSKYYARSSDLMTLLNIQGVLELGFGTDYADAGKRAYTIGGGILVGVNGLSFVDREFTYFAFKSTRVIHYTEDNGDKQLIDLQINSPKDFVTEFSELSDENITHFQNAIEVTKEEYEAEKDYYIQDILNEYNSNE